MSMREMRALAQNLHVWIVSQCQSFEGMNGIEKSGFVKDYGVGLLYRNSYVDILLLHSE